MAPKKKGGGKKKKKDDGAEPPHDACWERVSDRVCMRAFAHSQGGHCVPIYQAVESGVWEKPVTDLPDANTWPTWGALRERVLTACREVRELLQPEYVSHSMVCMQGEFNYIGDYLLM